MTNPKRTAFTLVELLTVVAIIAILMGIIVPSVNVARKQASNAAAKAQIHAISQGVEMFKADFGYYPSSLPQTTAGVDADADRTGATVAATPVEGAHRLAMAMLGRDQLGCPAKRGGRVFGTEDPGPDSLRGWYYTADASFSGTTNNVAGDIYGSTHANWGDPDYKTARKGPYIDPKGFNIVKDDLENNVDYMFVLSDRFDKKATEDITSDDDYDTHSVILYYAANERGKYLYRGATSADYVNNDDDNIYYYQDNQRIALSGKSVGSDTQFKVPYDGESFSGLIDDEKASIGTGANTTHRPVNPESFLLISKGYDGIYGTDDDVTNWTN